MTFYLSATIIIELLMIAMILHVVAYSGFTKAQKLWFVATFLLVIICSLAEYAVHCGVYKASWRIPLTCLTVIQFSLAPILTGLFTGALGMRSEARSAIRLFMVHTVYEVLAAPFGMVFYFNDEGYFRGDLYVVYEIVYLIALIYLVYSLIRVGRRFQHRDISTIVMVPVIIVAGIIPMTIAKIHVAYISIGICATLCYIYYNDLVQQDIQTELVENQEKISALQMHTISSLANLIENRDIETGNHVARTSLYAKTLAEDARADGIYTDIIDDRFIEFEYLLAPLHDVGKIVVSDSILKKPGRLTYEEYEEMKKHASAGDRVVKEVLKGVTEDEYADFAADIARYHHEWWNGRGYPDGLSEKQIPLSSRIMAIADVYDALVSERCYKKPYPPDEAFRIIEHESGTHFDPDLVKVFLAHKEHYI